MTPRQATDFIRHHGVVLQSARGLEPSFVERIAGEVVRGSWWSHPSSHRIFDLVQHVHASRAVLVCTLAHGKITYVHRDLWPFFVRTARMFPDRAFDKVREVHLPSGRHRRQDIPFPEWVPQKVLEAAKNNSDSAAMAAIDVWLQRYGNS
jgi:hypothetical protein